ncbi:hypothetical protein [Aeromicrobium sp. CnD17-E]|uniref:hypothetical protein n=1 Tax=Aeromicrobium sp. CnD17-E TaxID=2954487 RepID=UPI0020973CA3|nr:hypothetical protein [Aeromicrobium sp. CnD17-E]MCO7238794.1 hypothetical protein [Aeromicrobium sp. CnD17-E]
MKRSREQRSVLGSLLMVALAVLILGSAFWNVELLKKPPFEPPIFSSASGSISTDAVILEDVQICSCWHGPRGQVQKKLKFRVTNRSDDVVDIAGGQDSSVFLVVAYPNDFTPNLTLPSSEGAKAFRVDNPDAVPTNVTYKRSVDLTKIEPRRASHEIEVELGLEKGWSAWVIPANPNRVAEPDTYPTFVEKQRLRPGDSYVGSGGLGIGAWVFYVPVQKPLASTHNLSALPFSGTREWDKYYQVLGVSVLDADGGILGFAPLPPESFWTDPRMF